ncbi:PQQ-binding-like beta-propeller repeat protein [Chitinophaga sp. sic0106]|uniref:outer membrane protein assembly factor BamB family protein n=1 Tax=Chitinophaga sp. sic0106 TaxID=2854785 RepID=UPI001C464CBC|nr:PQQ-binding-like beta-propeller repeat protein [Chitinophaga sp. sic0106]MBV7533740.1 PQQ-like beta-propeller repeat protein [Chitinophaga sp. sic0106]
MKLLHTIGPLNAFILAQSAVITTTWEKLTGCSYGDMQPLWTIPVDRDDYYELIFDKVVVRKGDHFTQYDAVTGTRINEFEPKMSVCGFTSGEHIVLQEAAPDNQQLLHKQVISSGETCWTATIPAGFYYFAAHSEVLLLTDDIDELMGVDTATGNILWRCKVSEAAPGQALDKTGVPAVHGGYFYCFTEGQAIIKINAYTGKAAWTFYSDLVAAVFPSFYEDLVFFSGDKHIIKLNAHGEVIQEINFEPYVKDAPFYFRTRVAVTSDYLLLGNTRTCEVLVFDNNSGRIIQSFFTADKHWQIRPYLFKAAQDMLFVDMISSGETNDNRLNIYSLKPDDVS